MGSSHCIELLVNSHMYYVCVTKGKIYFFNAPNMLDLHSKCIGIASLNRYSGLKWHSIPSSRPPSEGPHLLRFGLISDVCWWAHILYVSFDLYVLICWTSTVNVGLPSF